MIDGEERLDPDVETYYTPRRIRYWLEHWRDLQELAIPTAPAIRYDKLDCQGGIVLDPNRAVEIVADIERAYSRLHPWGIEHQLVEWHMEGCDLVTIARSLRVEIKDAEAALNRASAAMARHLGWRE